MKILLRIICFLALFGYTAMTVGQCLPSDLTELGFVWIYNGTIDNKHPIKLALKAKPNGDLEGRYLYRTSSTSIKLAGSLKDNRISLIEYDSAGQPTAKFEGKFQEKDPAYSKNTTLRCEVMSGTWSELKSKRTLPFHTVMDSGMSGSLDDMYGTAMGDDQTNKAIALFKNAVVKGNKVEVAKFIKYPITITLQNGKNIIVKDASDFVAKYDKIFNPALKDAVAVSFTGLLFSKNSIVMMGNGQIWFDEGKVASINVSK